MARIPNEELERLKRDVPIAGLVEAAGVKLAKHGADLRGLCPFHDDKEPSLVVTPAKNLWHCLGACRTGGSVVDWIMKTERVSFRRAVDMLIERHPARPAVELMLDGDDQALLDQVAAYYHRSLKESPEALAYVDERGLKSAEMLDVFRLGFANRTLGYRLPAKHTKAGVDVRERLARLGILRESGHEHMNGSLVVPILDEGGHVVGMYGRKTAPAHSLRKGTPLHMYLPGPHKGVFNAAAFSSTDVILCEALIDALTFWAHGFRNVTSSYGVEGLTDELFAKLCGVKRVFVAYDHDDAGDRAAAEHGKRLRDAGVDVLRVVFPKGMDANEYAKKLAPADKSLRLVLDQAVPLAPRAVVVDVAAPAAKKEAPPSPTTPPAPPSLAAVSVAGGGDVSIALGDRTWRARGVEKNLTRSALRVTLFVHRGEQIFVDALDLYSAKSRSTFLREASRELVLDESALKKDLARVMMALEDEVERRLLAVTAPKAAHTMSADDEAEARLLLEDPHLLDHVLSDLEKCGVVGEETNKLVAYLAMTSRKLDDPLAVVIQSSSAAGKSSLLDAVLAFCPDEDLSKYSAMTGQSLYYMSGTSLAHKVLAVVEEQGAERASYALKLLQSEGELIIASTGKDESTGKLVTHEYKVEGPVAMMLTTTALDVDEELLNRCVVLSVDEEREQTRAIHASQRKRRTLQGVVARVRKDEIVRLHQNAQRLLRPVHVVNPFAERLTFRDDKTRTRRDFPKYLGLIDAIALLHQHQRPKKTTTVNGKPVDYIEVTLDDVARANAIAAAVLGRALDELQPQTRVVLGKLKAYVDGRAAKDGVDAAAVRFSQRDARDALALSDTALRKHMLRLCELELVVMHRVGPRAVYELCWRGEGDTSGARFLAGVADVDELSAPTAAAHTPPAAVRPPLAPLSHPLRTPFARASHPPVVDEESQNGAEFALQEPSAHPSYRAKANGHATAR